MSIPAADPCAAAGRETLVVGGARRFTEEECREAIAEDEARLGRPMSQRERAAFARGFLEESDRDEILAALLAAEA
jgi:hypothetical protein